MSRRRKLGPPQGGAGLLLAGMAPPQGRGASSPPPPGGVIGPQNLVALEAGTGTMLWYPQEHGELVAKDSADQDVAGTLIGAAGTPDTRLGLLGYTYGGVNNGVRFPYGGSASMSLCPGQSLTIYVLFEWDSITGLDMLAAVGDDLNSWVAAETSQFRNVTGIVRYLGSDVQATGGNLFGPSRGVYAVTFVYDVPAGGGNEKVEIVAGHTGVAAAAYQSGQNTSASLQGDDVSLDFFFVGLASSAWGNSFGGWIACVLTVEGQAAPERTAMSQMLSLPGRVDLPTGLAPSAAEGLIEPEASVARDPINSRNLNFVAGATTATRDGKPVLSLPSPGDDVGALLPGVSEAVRSGYVVFELVGDGNFATASLVSNPGNGAADGVFVDVVDPEGDGGPYVIQATILQASAADQIINVGSFTSGVITLLSWEYNGTNFTLWKDGVQIGQVASTKAPVLDSRSVPKGAFIFGTFVYYDSITNQPRSAAIDAELISRFNVGNPPS